MIVKDNRSDMTMRLNENIDTMATAQLNRKYLSPHCLRREWDERRGSEAIAAILGLCAGTVGAVVLLYILS